MSKPVTTLRDGLFQRRSEIKITKTQYGLVVGVGTNAEALKKALEKIPNNARLVDWEELDERDSYYHSINQCGTVYIFEVETNEPVSGN